jgi:hypothetical protein
MFDQHVGHQLRTARRVVAGSSWRLGLQVIQLRGGDGEELQRF